MYDRIRSKYGMAPASAPDETVATKAHLPPTGTGPEAVAQQAGQVAGSTAAYDPETPPALPEATSTPAPAAGEGSAALAVVHAPGGDTDGGPGNDRELELWEWLKALDNGRGSCLQYFAALKTEFDSDFVQIRAARLPSANSNFGVLACIDPFFFDALNVRPLGHRLLLARGIMKLPESS